jgi:hypothetical protein
MGKEQSWSSRLPTKGWRLGANKRQVIIIALIQPISTADGLAKAELMGVGRLINKQWQWARVVSRCWLSIESGTDELLAQRP